MLDGVDLLADILGRRRSLAGQFLDFVGYHRKAFASFTGPRGFDGGIQGEQVGLLGDGGDHLHHFADFDAARSQFVHGLVGFVGGPNSRRGDARGFGGVLRDLANAGVHLLGAGGDRGDVMAHLFGGGRNHSCLGRGFVGGRAHLLADTGQFFRRAGQSLGIFSDARKSGFQSRRQFPVAPLHSSRSIPDDTIAATLRSAVMRCSLG